MRRDNELKQRLGAGGAPRNQVNDLDSPDYFSD